MLNLALVALGGVFGSLSRYLFIESLPSLPIGVFVVNQLGVLVAGFVAYRISPTPQQRLFWITGFAGGFTTLSSFAYILHGSSALRGFGYSIASLLTSLLILNLLKIKAKP